MKKDEFDKLTIEQKFHLYYQFLDRELAGEERVWDTNEAKWTRAFINGLPDASFAVIEPAYKSGEEKNKNARHLPHHGAIAKHSLTNVDKPHLRNALARMNQIKPVTGSISAGDLQSRAKTHLVPHAKKVLPDSKWAKEGLAVHYFTESAEPSLLTEMVYTGLELREAEDGYHHAKLLLTHGDRVNKNNRVYPMHLWNREVPKLRDKILDGRFVGLSDHPGFFKGPSILDTVIKFTDIWIEDKTVFGDVMIIPTRQGLDVVQIAKAGVKVGTSSVGRGSGKKGDWTDPATGVVHHGVTIIQDDFEAMRFDLVFQPSVEDAGIVHFEQVGEIAMTLEKLEACWPELVTDVKGLAATEVLQEALQELGFPSLKAIKDKIEVQAQAIGRLHEEKHELELERGSLLETRDAILGIFDIEPEPDPLVNCEEPIKEARQQLLDDVQHLTEQLGARDHLIEKVKGEKAAWLILLKLWEAESAAEVDAQYESAKDQAELMLARGATPSGKGDTFVEGGDTEDISEAERKQRLLRACGMAP